MIYLRFVFVVLWMMVSFGVGFVRALIQWGNLDLNRATSRLFGVPVMKVLGLKIDFVNGEELEKHQPCVYVANHQGALDIASFGAIYPHHTVVVGKKEIAYIPVLNLFYLAMGNVLLDRGNRVKAVSSLAKAVERIKRKKASIWVFAEGTRNKSQDVMLPLKKGAFYLAVEAQLPIIPVVSSQLRNVVDWERRYLKKGGTIRIKVLPPIPTKGLGPSDIDRLAVEVREKMIEAVRGLSTD